eukprot:s9211_g1.t1
MAGALPSDVALDVLDGLLLGERFGRLTGHLRVSSLLALRGVSLSWRNQVAEAAVWRQLFRWRFEKQAPEEAVWPRLYGDALKTEADNEDRQLLRTVGWRAQTVQNCLDIHSWPDSDIGRKIQCSLFSGRFWSVQSADDLQTPQPQSSVFTLKSKARWRLGALRQEAVLPFGSFVRSWACDDELIVAGLYNGALEAVHWESGERWQFNGRHNDEVLAVALNHDFVLCE